MPTVTPTIENATKDYRVLDHFTVTAAAAAVALPGVTVGIVSREVIVSNLNTGATGFLWWGDSDTADAPNATRGIPLYPGETATIACKQPSRLRLYASGANVTVAVAIALEV